MKRFPSTTHPGRSRFGFSLVEAVLSVGVMSFGFLAVAPLLAVGINGARLARETRVTAQIAATLTEEAKQGTLTPGAAYFDSASNPCAAAQAAYIVQETIAPVAGSALSRLTLSIASPGNATRIYADVFPTPPAP